MNKETMRNLKRNNERHERSEAGVKEIDSLLKKSKNAVTFAQFKKIVEVAYYEGLPHYSKHFHSESQIGNVISTKRKEVDRFLREVKKGKDSEIVLKNLAWKIGHCLCEGDLIFPITAHVEKGECSVWGDRFRLRG